MFGNSLDLHDQSLELLLGSGGFQFWLLPQIAKESLLPMQWRVKFRHVSADLQGRRACLSKTH